MKEPEAERLLKLGWKKLDTQSPWHWKEPKTGAVYLYRDAVDVINIKKGKIK